MNLNATTDKNHPLKLKFIHISQWGAQVSYIGDPQHFRWNQWEGIVHRTPLIILYCLQVNNTKLEKLQERSLRIIHNDYDASFETLLKCSKQESLLTKRLKIMILEVFKTVNRLNPSCLHDLFTKNEVLYDLRTQKLEQPKRRTTTYGLRTFSYLGSKLWNLLASEYSEVNDIDL